MCSIPLFVAERGPTSSHCKSPGLGLLRGDAPILKCETQRCRLERSKDQFLAPTRIWGVKVSTKAKSVGLDCYLRWLNFKDKDIWHSMDPLLPRFDFGWLASHTDEDELLTCQNGTSITSSWCGQDDSNHGGFHFIVPPLATLKSKTRQAIARANAWLPHVGVEPSRVVGSPERGEPSGAQCHVDLRMWTPSLCPRSQSVPKRAMY